MNEALKDKIKSEYLLESNGRIFVKKMSEELIHEIETLTSKCRKERFSERVFWILNDIDDYPICIECGKQWKPRYYGLSTKSYHNNLFCSTKCSSNNENVRQKYKDTCIERFDVEYASQSDQVKEKSKATCLERYGVEYASQSLEVRNTIHNSFLEKYGVENPSQILEVQLQKQLNYFEKYEVYHPMQRNEVQQKSRETCLSNNGVLYPMQSEEIRNKSIKTFIEKYGVAHSSHVLQIQENKKTTNVQRYGVEYPSQNDEVKQKIKDTNQLRYGVNAPAQNPKIIEKTKITCMKIYGVENAAQSDQVKEKSKATCLERYGVEYVSQNPIITEKQNKPKYKVYTSKNNITRKYQGYENIALDILLEQYEENEIISDRFSIPTITYSNNKVYFPDIYIPKDNLIIEVKSEWTYKKALEKNEQKKSACLSLGYNFEFWICSSKTLLKKL